LFALLSFFCCFFPLPSFSLYIFVLALYFLSFNFLF